ncbi:MAG: peptide-methionine (S)-S-oxide reductase MsrA [Actinomycetales bacterium]|nr:peptide-methionine (S)-S-oxide reductase MsrA [Actinomycetales bacterium]
MTDHLVLGSDIFGPWSTEYESVYFGMGCFWGAEKKLWQIQGVKVTAVGYMGGVTPEPNYPLVCSGETGHAEIVLVVYNPAEVDFYDLLKVFWENHDPTQGNRQGNDIGTQYRSAVYYTTVAQKELVEKSLLAYQEVLSAAGLPAITTEVDSAEGKKFWYAEDYHQQYLIKNPNGYDCHANTGYALPAQDLIGL